MFALDLSENRIRVVELLRKQEEIFLNAMGERELASKETLPGILKDLTRDTKPYPIKSLDVALAIPEEKSLIKLVQLPKREPEELKMLLNQEIGKILPYSQEEVYWDWKVTGPREEEKNEHLDIIIVASAKAIVDSYITIVQQAGFQPSLIETEANALLWGVLNPLKRGYKEEITPTLVIDLGRSKATVVIFAKGAIRFTTSLKTEMIMSEPPDEVTMEWHEWVKTNKKNWLLTETGLTLIVSKLRECIDYYSSHLIHPHEKNGEALINIIVTGAWANVPEVVDILGEKLKMPVKRSPDLFSLPPIYTTALGLALRGIYEELSLQ